MLDVAQFRSEVVKPSLTRLGLWSQVAENLVVGTAIQESRLTYLRQIGGGPGRGLYQIEPTTHDDVWRNFLAYRAGLALLIDEHRSPGDRIDQLVTNLAYATAMCRVIYYRCPEPLPAADDIDGLGGYWKRHYNTPSGAGTADEWVRNYRAAMQEA